MTTVLFVFAEAVPKTSALQHTDAWVLPLAPFVVLARHGPSIRSRAC